MRVESDFRGSLVLCEFYLDHLSWGNKVAPSYFAEWIFTLELDRKFNITDQGIVDG